MDDNNTSSPLSSPLYQGGEGGGGGRVSPSMEIPPFLERGFASSILVEGSGVGGDNTDASSPLAPNFFQADSPLIFDMPQLWISQTMPPTTMSSDDALSIEETWFGPSSSGTKLFLMTIKKRIKINGMVL